MLQWLRLSFPKAGGPGLTPGQGTRSHSPQLRFYMPQRKTPRVCVLNRFSHVRLLVTPWTVAHHAPLSRGFSRQECWSGLLCSSRGIFQTQRLNPHLLHLLHWQVVSLLLAPRVHIIKHPFLVQSSMNFDKYIHPHLLHHNHDVEHFHQPESTFCPFIGNSQPWV